MVRKHAGLLVLSADGVIETGIGHCDAALSPCTAPDPELAAQVTARSLERAGRLAEARAAWRIGEPYVGTSSPVLRVRATRTLGLAPAELPPRLLLDDGTVTGPRSGPALRTALAALVLVSPAAVLPVADGAAAAVLLAAPAAAGAGRVAWSARQAARRPPDELEQQGAVVLAVARAVAQAMHEAGLAPVGAERVAVTRAPDGTLALTLTRRGARVADGDVGEDVGDDVVDHFVRAVEGALAPVGERAT